MTRAEAGRSTARILAGARDFSLLQNCPDWLLSQLSLVSTSSVVFSQARSGLGVQLTTHLHPVPGLRMSGAIPLFPYMPSQHRQGNFTFTDKSKLHACKITSRLESGNDCYHSVWNLLYFHLLPRNTNISLWETCVLYIGRAYRYPPDVAFYISFSTTTRVSQMKTLNIFYLVIYWMQKVHTDFIFLCSLHCVPYKCSSASELHTYL